MNECPQHGWSRTSLDRLVQELMLMIRLTGVLVVVVPNPSERLQHRRRVGLDMQSRAEVMSPVRCGAPIVVHFSYIKFAAE